MLASISPVGEASRGQRWHLTVAAYLLASVLGGGAVFAVAGALGWALLGGLGAAGLVPPREAVLGGLALAGLLAIAVDAGRAPLRLPSWQRQVDERWLTHYRGWVYGAGFGFQLGAAVLTRIPTAAIHLLLLFAVASASIPAGAALGATFGLVRALPLLTTAPLREPLALQRYHRHLDARSSLAKRITDGALAASVAVLAVGVAGAVI
ncbi:hypothetical protein [Egicoccus sp. AB-alg6-2]|uniref:hypothetical protein n=1 Tax=Egicoccus sp. AB-alg6-2 TaxID=3242692 RepID=UPI00359DE987